LLLSDIIEITKAGKNANYYLLYMKNILAKVTNEENIPE